MIKFINTDSLFKQYKFSDKNIEFYYTGVFDTSLESILHFLENGSFPNNLKGNFAFYYKDQERIVMAVDHAPTINLYYTDNDVSHVFSVLRTEDQTPNGKIEMQLKFYHGASFGSETSVQEIKRLEQGTYLEKNIKTGSVSIKEYINLYEHYIDSSVTINDIADITETIIDEQTRQPFNLLYSSGTDSNCILGFVRKLNRTDSCNLISFYSNETIYDEKDQIEELLKIYNLKTSYYKLGKYVGKNSVSIDRYNDPNETQLYKDNFDRIFRSNLNDNTIWQKFESVYYTGNSERITLTGEVGDELFGAGPPLKMVRYILQNPNYTSREIAILFSSLQIYRDTEFFVKESDQWLMNINHNQDRLAAWESAIDELIKIWEKIKTDDILNTGKLMQYYLMTRWRLQPYTQFTGVKFAHPFQDYRLFFNIWKLPGHTLYSHKGYARKGSYEIIKDHVTALPWELKKIGPTYMVSEDRLNKFRSVT